MTFSATRTLFAALTATAVVALAGCSGDTTSTPTSGTTSSVTASADATDTAASTTGANVSSASSGASNTESTPVSSTEIPPAATTEVPASGGGNINETVAPVSLTTNSPVQLTETGDYGNGVTVTLTAIEAVTAQAALPGEITGPGVKVTVDIVNNSAAAIDLGNVIVDLLDAAGTPSIPMTASPASPFTGSVEPGQTATGVYVFAVPATYTNPATISVSYSTSAPIVVFTGTAR